jgi:hypothetical protein
MKVLCNKTNCEHDCYHREVHDQKEGCCEIECMYDNEAKCEVVNEN